MKRAYTIEWDDDLGPYWLGKSNLDTCVRGQTHIGPNIKVTIKDITDPAEFIERAKAFLANPEIDEDVIIKAVALWLMTK